MTCHRPRFDVDVVVQRRTNFPPSRTRRRNTRRTRNNRSAKSVLRGHSSFAKVWCCVWIITARSFYNVTSRGKITSVLVKIHSYKCPLLHFLSVHRRRKRKRKNQTNDELLGIRLLRPKIIENNSKRLEPRSGKSGSVTVRFVLRSFFSLCKNTWLTDVFSLFLSLQRKTSQRRDSNWLDTTDTARWTTANSFGRTFINRLKITPGNHSRREQGAKVMVRATSKTSRRRWTRKDNFYPRWKQNANTSRRKRKKKKKKTRERRKERRARSLRRGKSWIRTRRKFRGGRGTTSWKSPRRKRVVVSAFTTITGIRMRKVLGNASFFAECGRSFRGR